jgi:hypothetical protein
LFESCHLLSPFLLQGSFATLSRSFKVTVGAILLILLRLQSAVVPTRPHHFAHFRRLLLLPTTLPLLHHMDLQQPPKLLVALLVLLSQLPPKHLRQASLLVASPVRLQLAL